MSLELPVQPAHGCLDLIDLSEVARSCLNAVEFSSERLEVECELALGLPLVLASPSTLSGLATRLVRRAIEVVEEDWGALNIATGVLGIGRSLFARQSALAGLASRQHVYLEVHSTGPAVAPLFSGLAAQPFDALDLGPLGLAKAVALLREFDGEIVVDPLATAGVSVLLLLPYAVTELP